MVTYPVLIIVLLWTKFEKLEEEKYVSSFGVLYQDIRTSSRLALFQKSLFVYRRVFFAAVALALTEYPTFQIQLMLHSSLYMLIYIGIARPFYERLIIQLEVFNELCILSSSYLLLVFTDFVKNDDIQYQAGWALILIAALNIIINLGVIIRNTVLLLWKTGKKLLFQLRRYLTRRKLKKEPLSIPKISVFPLSSNIPEASSPDSIITKDKHRQEVRKKQRESLTKLDIKKLRCEKLEIICEVVTETQGQEPQINQEAQQAKNDIHFNRLSFHDQRFKTFDPRHGPRQEGNHQIPGLSYLPLPDNFQASRNTMRKATFQDDEEEKEEPSLRFHNFYRDPVKLLQENQFQECLSPQTNSVITYQKKRKIMQERRSAAASQSKSILSFKNYDESSLQP